MPLTWTFAFKRGLRNGTFEPGRTRVDLAVRDVSWGIERDLREHRPEPPGAAELTIR